MPDNVEMFETDQITLAGYLALETGVDPQMEFDDSNMCYFRFPKTEECKRLVAIFMLGDARVEPKEYWKLCSHIKRGMFEEKDALAAQG